MDENFSNLNIFAGPQASFLQALPAFSAVPELAFPVKQENTGQAALHHIPQFVENGQAMLPAFTSAALLNPPLIKLPAGEAAVMLFHAPNNDFFSFNPQHPQARTALSPLRASRREISLLAGFLQAGAKTSSDPDRMAAGEFALGRLHAAHYLFTLAAAKNPASRARFALSSALIELGLLQEAYDGLKTDRDPEALLNLAVIHRKTGNQQAARDMLAAIPQGTPFEDRKTAEQAWLDLETGKEVEAEKAFKRLAATAFEKTEALSGLGAAIAKTAFRTKDKSRLTAAADTLRSALVTPAASSARIFFQLGNLYFRSGDPVQAEASYRRSAAMAPSIQAVANLAMTLLKTGRIEEAAAITLKVALTDAASAARLTAEFPKDRLASLFPPPQAAPQYQAPAQPAFAPRREAPAQPAPAADLPPFAQPRRQEAPVQAAPPPEANNFIFPGMPSTQSAPASAAASLAPAQPVAPPQQVSNRTQSLQPQKIQMETFQDMMDSHPMPTEAESRKDDFISRAFRLASALEDELGRKIYFNIDGLAEVEKKLRLTFIKTKGNPQANLETVKDCSAFLCYFLQERYKGRLIKFADFDPWGWPMTFQQPGRKITTYPIQRVWRMLWEPAVPEPGWLSKYTSWLADNLKENTPPLSGAAAARAHVISHQERLADAQTEHRRTLLLTASLPETSQVELARSGLTKLESALRNNFRADIPPTADGWKLLRCYGHILAEIMIKDFKAVWYNTDGEDGGWSMQLPWKTFIFPIGKLYKTASSRGSLGEYYETILADKLRNVGPGAA